MTALPAANAGAADRFVRYIGNFHGLMTTTIPELAVDAVLLAGHVGGKDATVDGVRVRRWFAQAAPYRSPLELRLGDGAAGLEDQPSDDLVSARRDHVSGACSTSARHTGGSAARSR
jgi:hypothetical protein